MLAVLSGLWLNTAWGQAILTCTVTAAPTIVKAEGQAEPMGDLVLQCSGGTPGTSFNAGLSIFLPVAITNRLNANGTAAGTQLLVNGANGPATATHEENAAP